MLILFYGIFGFATVKAGLMVAIALVLARFIVVDLRVCLSVLNVIGLMESVG